MSALLRTGLIVHRHHIPIELFENALEDLTMVKADDEGCEGMEHHRLESGVVTRDYEY